MNTNDRKTEQLGMPIGTASNKLRKMVLFSLLKELGRDQCYRCGQPINSIEELSIEHKIAWLDSEHPKELFFSLNNIAFSHLKCNVGAARHPNERVKETHQQMAKNGLHPFCKLNEEDVKEIREQCKTEKVKNIAKKYNISKHTIYRILKGATFSYVS